MNTRLNDKTVLTRAIDRAIGDLEAMKAKIYPSSIYDIRDQADSAEAYATHVEKIVEITSQLRIEALEVAGDLGGQVLSDGDRACIREASVIDDVLTDVRSWCDDAREEEAA